MQNGSCTHILANGGLSGTKTQKWIDGQGGRGLAKRMKVVKVDCELSLQFFVLLRSCVDMEGVLDSVEKGKRVSEAGYGVIDDPVSAPICRPTGRRSSRSRRAAYSMLSASDQSPKVCRHRQRRRLRSPT